MHYIQKQILDELRLTDSAHYVKINKNGIESGHFRYHLAQLVNDGYVEQLSRGQYALTAEGQHYIDKLSNHRINPHEMPKVITYTLLLSGGKVLLLRKSKKPYKDLLNMIGGKLHFGEKASEAAVREVKEKAGIVISNPKQAGVYEILINQDGSVFTHVIAYVFIARVEIQQLDLGALEALEIDDLPERSDLAPDFLELFEKAHKKETPFDQIIVDA